MPHGCPARLIEKSCRPPAMKRLRLVGAERRQDEIRPLLVQREQLLLIGGEPEEPVALLDPLRLDVVFGALAVDELRLGLERLAADAVQTGVDVLIDVVAAVVANALQELLHELLVPVVARPDEEVVGDVETGRQGAPCLGDAVDVVLGGEALFRGDAGDLRRVLVDAGEEKGVAPALPLMAREDVRGDGRVRVPDVRGRVHVVDRRRQVVRVATRTRLPCSGRDSFRRTRCRFAS